MNMELDEYQWSKTNYTCINFVYPFWLGEPAFFFNLEGDNIVYSKKSIIQSNKSLPNKYKDTQGWQQTEKQRLWLEKDV